MSDSVAKEKRMRTNQGEPHQTSDRLDNSRPGTAGSIPRPLVQANRAFLVLTIGAAFLLHPMILALPLAVGILALSARWHPVIIFGNRFLKKSPDHYRREDPEDQRFNQWIATVLLILASGSFLLGYQIPGYIFGGMVIVAAGVALSGFCIGCYIRFRYQQWRYRRK